MAQTQKLQTTATLFGVSQSISGYDAETGNAIVGGINQFFAASTLNQSISLAFTLSDLQSVAMLSDKGCTLSINGPSTGSADVQTLSIGGTPTGGYFGLSFGGVCTVLPFNSGASAVQAALQAMSSVGSGNITCTGGPLPGTAVVCTFSGSKAVGLQPLMTVYSGQLTGGSSPAASVAHTTPGTPTQTIVLQPGIPVAWGVSTGQACPFTQSVTSCYVSCANGQNLQVSGVTL